MLKKLLDEPGAEGTYDPETSLAGLTLTPEMLADFDNPGRTTWRPLMAAYHEWVHYYQFHATTFGYLHRLLWTAQMMTANGILRMIRLDRRREPLPLTAVEHEISFLTPFDGHPNDLNRTIVRRLQRYLDGILDYAPRIAMSDLPEWRAMMLVLHDLYGTPRTLILNTDYMPSPPFVRYPVTELLETHAHVLSSIWMLQALERRNGPPDVRREVNDYALAHLIGPYGAYTQFLHTLTPGCQGKEFKIFCALAEIALNPVGLHRHPRMSTSAVITPLYTSWYPVVRFETLMSWLPKSDFQWPADVGWPDSSREIVRSAERSLARLDSQTSAFFCGSDGAVVLPELEHAVAQIQCHAVDAQDVPLELLIYLLDGLGKLCAIEEIKSEIPLLLDGWVDEEFKLLTRVLGGPSTLRRPGSDVPSLIGNCSGLRHLGLLDNRTMQLGSDAIVHAGAPLVRALRLLLTHTREQLEKIAKEPLFGGAGWTLEGVLGHYYDLSLYDFS